MAPLPKIRPFEDFEEEAEIMLRPKFKSNFGMMRFVDLDQPGDELDEIVEDILITGGTSIIGGPSGSGKSFCAIDVGMAIATGRDFFGKKVKKGLVIYQAGEGARGVKNRLKAYRQHYSVPPNEDVPFVMLKSRIDLHAEDGDYVKLVDEINAIKTLYPEMPLQAFFIDTLSRASGAANENDGRDVGMILNHVDVIREKTGVHVALVHHLNADGTKLRGHTSLFANMDSVLSVICDAETKVRTLSMAKQKDGNTDFNIKFELLAVEVGEIEGKKITSCVVVKQGDKENFKNEGGERPFRPNPGESSFVHALLRALAEHSVPPPGVISCPPNINQVVEWKHVSQWYRRMNFKEDTGSDTKEKNRLSKAIERALNSLRNNGVIGADKPANSSTGWIWLTGKPVFGIKGTYSRTYTSRPPKKEELPPPPALAPDDDGLPFE